IFPDRHITLSILVVLIFAFSPANAPSIFYSAARYMFIVGVFCTLGLLAHIRWREQSWKPGRIISMVAFSLALLSGEASLAGLTFVVCYEMLYSNDSFNRRLKASAPVIVLSLIYVLLYKLLGYGTSGLDNYVNPFMEPSRFIAL